MALRITHLQSGETKEKMRRPKPPPRASNPNAETLSTSSLREAYSAPGHRQGLAFWLQYSRHRGMDEGFGRNALGCRLEVSALQRFFPQKDTLSQTSLCRMGFLPTNFATQFDHISNCKAFRFTMTHGRSLLRVVAFVGEKPFLGRII